MRTTSRKKSPPDTPSRPGLPRRGDQRRMRNPGQRRKQWIQLFGVSQQQQWNRHTFRHEERQPHRKRPRLRSSVALPLGINGCRSHPQDVLLPASTLKVPQPPASTPQQFTASGVRNEPRRVAARRLPGRRTARPYGSQQLSQCFRIRVATSKQAEACGTWGRGCQ